MMLAIAMALISASECEKRDKPDDWDDELDGVFDPMEHCSMDAPTLVLKNPDCEKSDDWDDERDGVFDSGCHPVFFMLTMRDPSTYCFGVFRCYDEFGTTLGWSNPDVSCDKGCDHYGVRPVFTSTEAVQDYKLEVLRQSLENLQSTMSNLKTTVDSILHPYQAPVHGEMHSIG